MGKLMRGAAVVLLAALSACDEQPEENPWGAAPEGTGSTSSQTAGAAPDWDAVVAADMDGEAHVLSMSHLARYVDHWHRGAAPRVTLRCDADGVVRDGQGNAASIGAPEWKAMVTEIRGLPTSTAAAQAMMAASHDYRDGIGSVPRHAYFVEASEDWSLTFVVQGSRDHPSGG